jgi:hypothetical protein
MTFDVGYRYFQIDAMTLPLRPPVQHQLSASELVFTLRFYEPFRRWRQ